MNMKFIFIMFGVALVAGSARGQSVGDGDLRGQIEELRRQLALLQPMQGEGSIGELKRRIDLLAAEIEKLRAAGAEPTLQEAPPKTGLAPAASKVYGAAKGVSLGGYGEAVYNNFSGARQDGAASGLSNRIDLLRSVLYVGYKFDDRTLVNTEIEFEHATTGEGAEEKGEVSVEFAYLDFKPWKHVGLRAGLVLVPMGFVNEMHEAPVFHGALRPEVERAILPSTWREGGVGIYGDTGPLQWRGYVVAGLDSTGFDASGIREGRQGGSQSLAESLALTGRVDYTGVDGAVLGASLFTGGSGQGRGFAGRVTIVDTHAQYESRGAKLRAVAAWTKIGDAAAINAERGLLGSASVGERQRGAYVEGAFDLMTLRPAGRLSIEPFVRREWLDTQSRVPVGFQRDPERNRRVLTVGLSVKPMPNVVLKADRQWLSNRAKTGVNQWNLGVGYLF